MSKNGRPEVFRRVEHEEGFEEVEPREGGGERGGEEARSEERGGR